ncbi:MAG: oxidative damage protection protein [Pseudomonadota bacterium]|nr:oxidative damage protection protein [Pseudomonadota bacterium]
MTRMVHCVKLQQEAEGLDRAPYPGNLGQQIFEQISSRAWQMWLSHQTMLINEYRLNLMDPTAREFLQTEMVKFLFEGGSDKPSGFVPMDSEIT